MSQEWIHTIVFLAGVAGAAMFVLGLHRMNSPATARSGNQLSAVGMTIAVLSTLLGLVTAPGGLSGMAWLIILVGFAIGGGLGLYAARSVKMTAMPQLVSMFNAVGGGAAALVAISDFIKLADIGADLSTTIFVVLGAVIGCVTFTGSIIAGGKLQGLIPGKPIIVPGGQAVTIALAVIALAGTAVLVLGAGGAFDLTGTPSVLVLGVIVAAGLVFGVTMVMPIGGADMPVVISLLNSFTGTAAAMAGFVIQNPVLIISGALVGASGGILTKLMADAMNRSVMNIIAGGVRDSSPAEKAGIRPGEVITEVDHQPVANAADMKRLLAKHAKGAPVVVLLHRDGNSLYAAMTSSLPILTTGSCPCSPARSSPARLACSLRFLWEQWLRSISPNSPHIVCWKS